MPGNWRLYCALCLVITSGYGQEPAWNPSPLCTGSKVFLSYQSRGDRCEGFYALNVAGSARLELVSLTDSFPLDLEPQSVGAIHLAWKAPADSSRIRLRANSLRYKLYYEMDTTAPSRDGTFKWLMDVLKQTEIQRRDLGLLALTTLDVNSKRLDAYLPLAAMKSPSNPTAQPVLDILVTPSVELSEVYYSVFKQSMDGVTSVTLTRSKPLGLSYYPQHRAIRLPIAVQSGRYLYLVDVTAKVAQGGSVGTGFRIYYAR